MSFTARTAVLSVLFVTALSGLTGCSWGAPEPQPAQPARPAPTATVVQRTVQVGPPIRVTIPAIGVNERLHGVGLKPNGAMETPQFGQAGWYDLGPRPGASGPSVIVAHVHGPAGDDVFARLHELKPGDGVTIDRTDGSSTFVVDSVERVKKSSLPYDRIWNDTDVPELRLITCGGEPDPVTRVYPDNTIVYAHLGN